MASVDTSKVMPLSAFHRLPHEVCLRILSHLDPNQSNLERAALATCLRLFPGQSEAIHKSLYATLDLDDLYEEYEPEETFDDWLERYGETSAVFNEKDWRRRQRPIDRRLLAYCTRLIVPRYLSGFKRGDWTAEEFSNLQVLQIKDNLRPTLQGYTGPSSHIATMGTMIFPCRIHISKHIDQCFMCEFLRDLRPSMLVLDTYEIGDMWTPTLMFSPGDNGEDITPLGIAVKTLVITPRHVTPRTLTRYIHLMTPFPALLYLFKELIVIFSPDTFFNNGLTTAEESKGTEGRYETLVYDLVSLMSADTPSMAQHLKLTIVGIGRFPQVTGCGSSTTGTSTPLDIQTQFESDITSGTCFDFHVPQAKKEFEKCSRPTRFVDLPDFAEEVRGTHLEFLAPIAPKDCT
ncbi:hypothetical protein BD324DRAFT_619134 [Kockovaella imperatae]|uniref:F-box domain-containing protein n=1 Tax=Kockovaella imperatae TaxID=4999 RepID=A0A1Y1UP86_9TREE|nr:hypothetical protein BD324DRAFT_619134 [Kockovaella imperatae]ORX39286.1 hypothetical protein BD324DRAFT_619134 [Kockovaella imperatae]